MLLAVLNLESIDFSCWCCISVSISLLQVPSQTIPPTLFDCSLNVIESVCVSACLHMTPTVCRYILIILHHLQHNNTACVMFHLLSESLSFHEYKLAKYTNSQVCSQVIPASTTLVSVKLLWNLLRVTSNPPLHLYILGQIFTTRQLTWQTGKSN